MIGMSEQVCASAESKREAIYCFHRHQSDCVQVHCAHLKAGRAHELEHIRAGADDEIRAVVGDAPPFKAVRERLIGA